MRYVLSLSTLTRTVTCANPFFVKQPLKYHELDVAADDIELVFHGEFAIEVQQNKGDPGETHSGAGQDAAPQGTVEGRLLHCCSHLLQEGIGSMTNKEDMLVLRGENTHCVLESVFLICSGGEWDSFVLGN